MKLTNVMQALFSFELLYLVEAAQCNADNCARAATGTRDGQQSLRLASCSSFQQCTFTPKPVTSTEYVTVTPETFPALNCPTDIPFMARTCDGPERYQSACSCAGVTRSTITTTTPTVTTTVTVTATEPELPPPAESSGFRLQVDAGAYQGYYIKLSSEGSSVGQYASMQQINRQDATVFHLSGTELLFGQDFEGNQLPEQAGGPVYFNREARGRAILNCEIANGGINSQGFLRCASDGNNTKFFGCEGFAGSGAPNANVRYLRLGNEQPRFCAEQNLRVLFTS